VSSEVIDEELWNVLAAEPPRGAGLVKRRVREDSKRNLFLGIAYPGRERVLALVVSTDAVGDTVLPNTGALRTTQEPGDPGEIELRIVLTVPEMAAVFTPFCDDVVSAVAEAENDRDGVRALAERFAYWRRLLAAGDAGLSSVEAQALFGELWVVTEMVLPIAGDRAMEAWRGPDHEDRDVLVHGLGIEVKTTRGDEPTAVTITNEAQLNTEGLAALYLVALKLEVLRGGTGGTLNQAVATLRSSLGPEAAAIFRDKLLRYGYLDQHSARYEAPAYVIREVAAYEVGENFPRIIEPDLAVGVGSVTYRLALSACEPWRRTLAEVNAAVLAAAGGQG